MASRTSSADRAEKEAMMADLGDSRLEQLAVDRASPSHQRPQNSSRPLNSQTTRRHVSQSHGGDMMDSGASRWKSAVTEGAFNDEDYRGVKNLDSIENGNAHRRNNGPLHTPTYDPINPLGPRGNPSRVYSSGRRTGRRTGLPTPNVISGVGRGTQGPVRAVTQPTPPTGRGRGTFPGTSNAAVATAQHGRFSTYGTSQGLTGTQPGTIHPTIPQVPSVIVSQPEAGGRVTAETNIVPPKDVVEASPAGGIQAHENGVVKADNQSADPNYVPPHLRRRKVTPNKSIEVQTVNKSQAGAMAPPSDPGDVIYREADTSMSLSASRERDGESSIVTLYKKPKVDTVFWEVRTKTVSLRGDIRNCVAPAGHGMVVYLRRQEGKDALVQNCYIRFSSIAAAEKFKTALNFHRDKHANSKGEIFREISEDLRAAQELSAKKILSPPTSPETEKGSQTAVENLIDLDTTKSSEKSSSTSGRPQSSGEILRQAAAYPMDDAANPAISPQVPLPSEQSSGHAKPVSTSNVKRGNAEAKRENGNTGREIEDEKRFDKDPDYQMLIHSMEMIEKIPAGKHLSRESLRVLSHLTSQDYHALKTEFLATVKYTRRVLQPTSMAQSQLMDMRAKCMALDVAAKKLCSDICFKSLRKDEQKQVCAVVYTNVKYERKCIVRSIEQLIELRPSLSSCPPEVAAFHESLRMYELDKKYNLGPSSIDWDMKSERVVGDFSDVEETEKQQEEEIQHTEEEQKIAKGQKHDETTENHPSLNENRTLDFLLGGMPRHHPEANGLNETSSTSYAP